MAVSNNTTAISFGCAIESRMVCRLRYTYTVSQKTRHLIFLIITLANVNQFSKFFHSHIRKKIHLNIYHKDIHNTLIMLPQYRGKCLTTVRSHQRGQTRQNSDGSIKQSMDS